MTFNQCGITDLELELGTVEYRRRLENGTLFLLETEDVS
jgi:hypothetical protein